MPKIRIVNLEVRYNVGVTDEERAEPQRLLITIEIDHDFSRACANDRIEDTIDYHQVVAEMLNFGNGRSWRLIETLAANAASMILEKFGPQAVTVEVKKFIIPQAEYVSVVLTRAMNAGGEREIRTPGGV